MLNATIAADGRVVFDPVDPPLVLLGNETPPRTPVAYLLRAGDDWEAGAGVLRGTVGEKLADKTRPLTLALERVSVLRSSLDGMALDMAAGDAVQVSYTPEPGLVSQQCHALILAALGPAVANQTNDAPPPAEDAE